MMAQGKTGRFIVCKGARMNMIYKRIFGELDEIQSAEDLAKALENLLNSGWYVWGDGELINAKQLVAREKGLKIIIYPDEHAPPHFHIKSAEISATFTIAECERLNGTITWKDEDLVKYWHKIFKNKLITAWNGTRPTDCPVGAIV